MGMRVVVPAVGWAEAGVLREWHKDDGDWINVGAALCTVQIGSSKHSLTALDSGFLRLSARKVDVGAVVKRGDLLGLILAPGESSEPLIRGIPTPPSRAQRYVDTNDSWIAVAARMNSQRRRISPRARRAALDAGLRWERLQGSGASGRIIARDVEAAARLRPAHAAVPESHQLVASATFAVTADGGTLDFQAAADDLLIRALRLLQRRAHGSAQEICFAFPTATGIHYSAPEKTTAITPAVIEALRSGAHQKAPLAEACWLLQDVVAYHVATVVMPLPAGYHGAVVIGKDQDVLRATVIADQRQVALSDVLQLLRDLRAQLE